MRRKRKEGDVYNWSYKNTDDMFEPYHCKSQIAICKNDIITDTFWSSENLILDLKKVNLTFLFNFDDVVDGTDFDYRYYKPSDLFDISHSNNTIGGKYRNKDAKRDIDVMKRFLDDGIKSKISDFNYLKRDIERLKEQQKNLTVDDNL